MAAGVYWIGQDNNVWTKGADGVQNRGALIKDYGNGFDAGTISSAEYTRINDPAVQQAPATDPQAAAKAAAQSAARESFGIGKSNIYSSATTGADAWKSGQRNNILDFIDSLRSGQSGIDNQRINNEVNRQRGTSDVLGMVSRGLQSGGVMLANRNASNSSAAEAIARAYGELGQRQQSGVNNQFSMGERGIDQAQQAFDTQRQSGLRRFATDKVSKIDEIVGNAQNAFVELNQQAANADITDRVAIEQEKENIRNQVLSQLAELDQVLGGQESIQAAGRDQIRSQATGLNQSGAATPDQFTYDSQAPLMQQSGPSLGMLPLYSNRRRGY